MPPANDVRVIVPSVILLLITGYIVGESLHRLHGRIDTLNSALKATTVSHAVKSSELERRVGVLEADLRAARSDIDVCHGKADDLEVRLGAVARSVPWRQRAPHTFYRPRPFGGHDEETDP